MNDVIVYSGTVLLYWDLSKNKLTGYSSLQSRMAHERLQSLVKMLTEEFSPISDQTCCSKPFYKALVEASLG